VATCCAAFYQTDAKWSSWSGFGNCSKECGFGYKIRSRICVSTNGSLCKGIPIQDKICKNKDCANCGLSSFNATNSSKQVVANFNKIINFTKSHLSDMESKKTKLEAVMLTKESQSVKLSQERVTKMKESGKLKAKYEELRVKIAKENYRKVKMEANLRNVNSQIRSTDQKIGSASRRIASLQRNIKYQNRQLARLTAKVNEIRRHRRCGFGKKRGMNPLENKDEDNQVEQTQQDERDLDLDLDDDKLNSVIEEQDKIKRQRRETRGTNKKEQDNKTAFDRVGVTLDNDDDEDDEIEIVIKEDNEDDATGNKSDAVEENNERGREEGNENITTEKEDLEKQLEDELNDDELNEIVDLDDDLMDEDLRAERRKRGWGWVGRVARGVGRFVRGTVNCVVSNTIGRINRDKHRAENRRNSVNRQLNAARQSFYKLTAGKRRLVLLRVSYGRQVNSMNTDLAKMKTNLKLYSRSRSNTDGEIRLITTRINDITTSLARIHVELKDVRYRKSKVLEVTHELRKEASEKINDLREVKGADKAELEDLMQDLKFINSSIEKSVKKLRYLMC